VKRSWECFVDAKPYLCPSATQRASAAYLPARVYTLTEGGRSVSQSQPLLLQSV